MNAWFVTYFRSRWVNIIKAYFAVFDSEPYPYYGIVRFFFKSSVMIKGDNVHSTETIKSHGLTYVQWLQFYNDSQQPFVCVTDNYYEGDEIISLRQFLSRCIQCIAQGIQ